MHRAVTPRRGPSPHDVVPAGTPLDEDVVDAARQRLRNAGVDPDAARPVYEVVTATFADTIRAFGESLPNGLRLGGDVGGGPSAL